MKAGDVQHDVGHIVGMVSNALQVAQNIDENYPRTGLAHPSIQSGDVLSPQELFFSVDFILKMIEGTQLIRRALAHAHISLTAVESTRNVISFHAASMRRKALNLSAIA